LAEAYQTLVTAVNEITALQHEVLPGAQEAFQAVQEGYRQGKFGFVEVLDAQRTLSETRGRYLEALATYHKAVADVERLIGAGLPTVMNPPEPQKNGAQR
jgi:cobalt-zinc-cadmium efflux system outer membrane protein